MVTFFLPQRRLPRFLRGTAVGVEPWVDVVVDTTVEEGAAGEFPLVAALNKLTKFDEGVTLTLTLKLF